MKHHRKRAVAMTGVSAVAVLIVTVLFVVPALATPPNKVVTATFGVGRFDNIDSTTKTDIDPGAATDFWQARINTKGASDLYVLQNTIAPGGTFGWHSHPGPSLVIVKSGTATFYMADDPTCTPQVVSADSTNNTFLDNGHDTHVVPKRLNRSLEGGHSPTLQRSPVTVTLVGIKPSDLAHIGSTPRRGSMCRCLEP